MTDIIKLKRSSVAGKRPTAAQLEVGELAVNLVDRILFTKDADDVVVELLGSAAAGGTGYVDLTTRQYIFGGKLFSTGTALGGEPSTDPGTALQVIGGNDLSGRAQITIEHNEWANLLLGPYGSPDAGLTLQWKGQLSGGTLLNAASLSLPEMGIRISDIAPGITFWNVGPDDRKFRCQMDAIATEGHSFIVEDVAGVGNEFIRMGRNPTGSPSLKALGTGNFWITSENSRLILGTSLAHDITFRTNSVDAVKIKNDRSLQLLNLAGSGVRMVTTSPDGTLSHAAIPVSGGGEAPPDLTTYLLLDGSRPMSAALNLGNFRINQMADPSADTDGVNKRSMTSAITIAVNTAIANKISEAPADGKLYGRQNNNWVEALSSGGTPVVTPPVAPADSGYWILKLNSASYANNRISLLSTINASTVVRISNVGADATGVQGKDRSEWNNLWNAGDTFTISGVNDSTKFARYAVTKVTQEDFNGGVNLNVSFVYGTPSSFIDLESVMVSRQHGAVVVPEPPPSTPIGPGSYYYKDMFNYNFAPTTAMPKTTLTDFNATFRGGYNNTFQFSLVRDDNGTLVGYGSVLQGSAGRIEIRKISDLKEQWKTNTEFMAILNSYAGQGLANTDYICWIGMGQGIPPPASPVKYLFGSKYRLTITRVEGGTFTPDAITILYTHPANGIQGYKFTLEDFSTYLKLAHRWMTTTT